MLKGVLCLYWILFCIGQRLNSILFFLLKDAGFSSAPDISEVWVGSSSAQLRRTATIVLSYIFHCNLFGSTLIFFCSDHLRCKLFCWSNSMFLFSPLAKLNFYFICWSNLVFYFHCFLTSSLWIKSEVCFQLNFCLFCGSNLTSVSLLIKLNSCRSWGSNLIFYFRRWLTKSLSLMWINLAFYFRCWSTKFLSFLWIKPNILLSLVARLGLCLSFRLSL